MLFRAVGFLLSLVILGQMFIFVLQFPVCLLMVAMSTDFREVWCRVSWQTISWAGVLLCKVSHGIRPCHTSPDQSQLIPGDRTSLANHMAQLELATPPMVITQLAPVVANSPCCLPNQLFPSLEGLHGNSLLLQEIFFQSFDIFSFSVFTSTLCPLSNPHSSVH